MTTKIYVEVRGGGDHAPWRLFSIPLSCSLAEYRLCLLCSSSCTLARRVPCAAGALVGSSNATFHTKLSPTEQHKRGSVVAVFAPSSPTRSYMHSPALQIAADAFHFKEPLCTHKRAGGPEEGVTSFDAPSTSPPFTGRLQAERENQSGERCL